MKYLRKPTIVRCIVSFFIFNFLSSVFIPNYSFALTGGPHQIEYTSYEDPGATDMVNLLTGDFTYNLPIIEVPGPEGSFSLPLSYHAGIGLDQEASWVGLGWTMNAGAITRNINEFPDDANGESHTVTVQDLNVIKGWDSNLGLVNIGWNNQVGHYGSVNLFNLVSTSWNDSGINSVGIAGVTVSNGGVAFDAASFVSAVITVASWGAGGVIDSGKIVAQELVKAAAIDAATQFAFGAAMGGSTPNAATSGYWKQTKKTKRKFLHKEYKIWLNHTRTEDMYGVLNLGNVNNYETYTSVGGVNVNLINGGVSETLYKFKKSTGNILNKGSASDVNYQIDDNQNYYQMSNPAVLAFDDYNVSAAGVSGSISPYRFDVGSVSTPREMTTSHDRLAPVKYLDYKVPFMYEGVPANSYFHHVGGASAVTSPAFYFGISHSVGNPNPPSNTTLTYNLNDVALKNERIRANVNTDKKLATANHIEWLSNIDIKNATTYPSKFIDFLAAGSTSSDRYLFRSNFTLGSTIPTSDYTSTTSFSNIFNVSESAYNQLIANVDLVDISGTIYENSTDHSDASNGTPFSVSGLTVLSKSQNGTSYSIQLSDNSIFQTYAGKEADLTITFKKTPQLDNAIGGYVITAPDGTSYHFALPVYDYDLKTEVKDVTDSNKGSIMQRKSAFANTWLLTAITYSDFIDRNNNGLADDGDWGGWIKMNYGKGQDAYAWRAPFSGYKNDPENKSKSYTQGTKQLYYLNSIETRSHVALFLKGNRTDGQSLNSLNPMKLDEVAILSKEHYKKLVLPVGSGGFGIPEFSNKITNVCLSSLFTPTSIRNFINNNSVKRVLFTYSYDLCPGTPNSTTGGKLTLTKVSIKGRGADVSVIPDYKFEYGDNPAYNQNRWDGWGYYHSGGDVSGLTHKPQAINDGAAWSLKKIITPLGSAVEVNYERDIYASISGTTPAFYSTPFTDKILSDGVTYVSSAAAPSFTNGERVKIKIEVDYHCPPGSCGNPQLREDCTGELVYYRYGTISGTTVQLDAPFTPPAELCGDQSPMIKTITGGTVERTIGQTGGDLRVGSIVMKDEFGVENKIRYLYTKSDGSSSGVIAKQNPYAKHGVYAFDDWQEYPSTPVMYGTVSVLNGVLSNDNDFHTKTVYEFETPHTSLVTQTSTTVVPTTLIAAVPMIGLNIQNFLTMKEYKIENRTAKIGNLNSIKVYDKQGTLKSNSQMNYTSQIINDASNNYQGIYSQGTLMFETVKKSTLEYYHKANRTTVLRYAYTLKEVINTKDGNTSKSENTKWDFITGTVLEKVETSPTGIKVKSVTVPAYKIPEYAEFGPKTTSLTNKNMLTQTASEYTYLLGSGGEEIGLLSGSSQTWKKAWNKYRVYSGGSYSDGAEGDQIWRKGPSYAWKGDYSRLRSDGSQTFAAGDKFNFAIGATNNGWQYLGEITRYDHFNMPLESKGFDSIYSVSKMGYDTKIKILSAGNAKYNEVAFSSAEDLDGTTGYFGGEVALKNSGGAAIVVKKSAGSDSHTGDCAVSLASGYGFVYKPTGLKANKTYRAAVWANSTNGRIYYKLDGGAEQLSAAPTAQTKAGNWYLINFNIPIGSTFTSLEVGVKSASGTVLFDDFRFQPADASMVCYVYNPLDFEHTTDMKYSDYVLDNDNLYSRYLYNEKGLLYRTYRESIKFGGEKLISESNNDYRRFHINQ